MHQIRFVLGELTALPQTYWLDFRGTTSNGSGRGTGKSGKEGRDKEGRKE